MKLTEELIDNLDSIHSRMVRHQVKLAEGAGVKIPIGDVITSNIPIHIEPTYASKHWNEIVSLNFIVKVHGVVLFVYAVSNDIGMQKYSPEEIVSDIYKDLPGWWKTNKVNYSDAFQDKVSTLIDTYLNVK